MREKRGNRVVREIAIIRRALVSFDRSLRRLAWMVGQLNGSIERRRKPRATSRQPLSAKARAALVLQGRYMGFMRQLKPRQKALVRKVKEVKGVRAAIARARGLAQS
jgi:hypothetical protein